MKSIRKKKKIKNTSTSRLATSVPMYSINFHIGEQDWPCHWPADAQTYGQTDTDAPKTEQ
jgi:hypothetical protein